MRGERGAARPARRRGLGRRKVCRFCADKQMAIDYKDARTLGTFLSGRDMIRRMDMRIFSAKQKAINNKDAHTLGTFLNERGKIIPARITGNCARHQRRLTAAIKQARTVALLPYTTVYP